MSMYPLLVVSLLAFLTWLVVYFRLVNHRKYILSASLLSLPFTLFFESFIPWYKELSIILGVRLWGLGISVEGLLFAFSLGGMAYVLILIVMKQRFREYSLGGLDGRELGGLSAILVVVVLLGVLAFPKSSMLVGVTALVASTLWILWFNRHVIRLAFLGMVTFLSFYLFFFGLIGFILNPELYIQIAEIYRGVTFMNILVEEILLVAVYGSFWAALLFSCLPLRLRARKKRSK